MNKKFYDFVIIGSGFGGSVSAMRLAQKGYRVLVLERGKRFKASDFPQTNWHINKFLWLPALRCFGIMGIHPFKDIWVLNGSGVGGGSLVYAGVMMRPGKPFFQAAAWRDLADWESELQPHYQTAEKMMGVTPNPRFEAADHICHDIATSLGCEDTFQPAPVSVYFGEPGVTVPDPYFGGAGPMRTGCSFCGNCMVGCRHNGKNTLDKNYLYFAEKFGADIRAEAKVDVIRPLAGDQIDNARYEIGYRRSTAWMAAPQQKIRTRNVIVAAGVLGTLNLLLHCRDDSQTLPALSPQLGLSVRSNGEALLGVTARHKAEDFSTGVAITSSFWLDEETSVEPVRYGRGSSFMRNTAVLLNGSQGSTRQRLAQMVGHSLRHPRDFMKVRFLPDWSRDSTIFLVMQTAENHMRFRLGRGLFGTRMVSERDEDNQIPAVVAAARPMLAQFAEHVDGIPQAMFNEVVLNTPSTAHILGGCTIGRNADEGVVDLHHEVFNYPGLYVVDASVIPANLGVNPSLTVLALAERAMQQIPPANGNRETDQSVLLGENYTVPTIPFINPATGQLFGEVRASTPEDVDAARQDLAQAFQIWRHVPVKERARLVKKLQAVIVDSLDEITAVVSQDIGKSRQDALIELLLSVDRINQYCKRAPRWLKRRRVPTGLYVFKRYYTQPRPYGVVAVLSPWNYPFDLCVPTVCAALLAGNTVLLKPSDISAATGALIADLFRRIPELAPFVRVVHGGKKIGKAVVASCPDLISLTGATETGKQVMQAAGKHLIPVLCELGGKDPMIVLADADIMSASRWCVWGAFFNAGQTCMGIERVYVESPVYDSFVEAVVEFTRDLEMGYDFKTDSPYQMGPVAYGGQLKVIESHLQDALAKGAKVLTGGQRQGLFLEPTVIVDVNHQMALMCEETFGPVLPIMSVQDESEAIKLANDSPYGLSASVWSRNLDRAQQVAQQLEVGAVNINDALSHYAVPLLPFGGVKQSGNARTHGKRDVLQYTQYVSTAVGRPPLTWDLATMMREPGHYRLGTAVIRLMFGVGWRQRIGQGRKNES